VLVFVREASRENVVVGIPRRASAGATTRVLRWRPGFVRKAGRSVREPSGRWRTGCQPVRNGRWKGVRGHFAGAVGPLSEAVVADLVFAMVTLGGFALLAALVRGLERL